LNRSPSRSRLTASGRAPGDHGAPGDLGAPSGSDGARGPDVPQVAGTTRTRRRRRRRHRVLLGAAAVLVLAYLGVTVAFFVKPTLGAAAHPQAVVVLDGYGNRDAQGFALARLAHVRTVAVSWPPYASCPAPRSGLRILCFVPHPANTQGEACAVARLARRHRWRSLMVVAGTTQVVRARVYLASAYSGHLAFSGVDPSGVIGWLYQIAYGQGGLVKALFSHRGC
jgi:hypothetical protein